MATFQEIITSLQRKVENNNTRTEAELRDALVKALKEVSVIPVLFMEDTASFATVVGQSDYTDATVGFPKGVREFHAIYYPSNTDLTGNRLLSGPVPVRNVRAMLQYPQAYGDPQCFAWHHDTLILAPPPSTVVTLYVDYVKDATRDEASGNVITAAATGFTNAWMDRGQLALESFCLWLYYSTVTNHETRAALARQRYDDAIEVLRTEKSQLALQHAIPDWCL